MCESTVPVDIGFCSGGGLLLIVPSCWSFQPKTAYFYSHRRWDTLHLTGLTVWKTDDVMNLLSCFLVWDFIRHKTMGSKLV